MRKTNALGLSVLAFAAVSCSSGAQLEQKARTAMEDSLFDAPSARFKELRAVTNPDGEKLICGAVNAKNQLGGYVGFRNFVMTDDGQEWIIDPKAGYQSSQNARYDQDEFNSAWVVCDLAR